MSLKHISAAAVAAALATTMLAGVAEATHTTGTAPPTGDTAAAPALPTRVSAASADCSPEHLAFAVFPEYKKFRDSRRLRTPVVVHGKVSDPAGNPVRRAQVLLAAQPVGDPTVLVPIAVNRTDDHGRYLLRAPMTRKLRALYDRDNGIDLHMEWFVPGPRHLIWASTVKWDATRRAWQGTKLIPAHRGPGTRTATPRNREDINLDPTAGRDLAGFCTG